MSTIDKTTAEKIMAGQFSEDGWVKIVTYNNMFDGGISYGAVHRREHFNRYEESPACHNVKTIWLEGQKPI